MKDINQFLPKFEEYIIETQNTWKVPGLVVAVSKNNEPIYKKAFGVKQLGQNAPIDTQTLFQVGSITKAFTATLIATLIAENKLNWNSRVTDFVPEFSMYDNWVTREFTVEDLFTHRSGLPPAAGMNLLSFGFDSNHLIHSLRYIKPITSFRSTFCYQNLPYLVAGKIIENLTEKSWEQNLQERILNPLKMQHSSSTFAAFSNEKNIAFLHKEQNSKLTSIPLDWPYHDWIDKIGPGGGINSNVDDILTWLNFQMGLNTSSNQILPNEIIRELHKPIVTAANPQLLLINPKEWQETISYGLGWISSDFHPHRIIYHAGGTLGHTTMAAFIPEEKLSLTIFTNNKNLAIFALLRDFYDRYFAKPHRDWNKILFNEWQKLNAAIKTPSKTATSFGDLSRYTGTYYNEAYKYIVVENKNDKLTLTLGPKQVKFTLIPWNNSCFMLKWPGDENTITPTFVDKPDFVSFECDVFEQVKTMKISLLNDLDRLGVFEKIA